MGRWSLKGNEHLTSSKAVFWRSWAHLRPVLDLPSQVHWAVHLDFHSSWTPGITPVSLPHLTTQPRTQGREPQVCSGQCQDHQCHWSSIAVFNTSLSPVLKEGTGTNRTWGTPQKFLHSLLCVGTSVMCVHQKGAALTQIQDLGNHRGWGQVEYHEKLFPLLLQVTYWVRSQGNALGF